MLRRGAREFDLSLADSVMIGDRCSDIAAANAAGLRQAFLISGTEQSPLQRPTPRSRLAGRGRALAYRAAVNELHAMPENCGKFPA